MSRCTHQWSWAPSLVNFQNIKFHFVLSTDLVWPSNFNSSAWYTVHKYIECNAPVIVMLLRPISSCFNLKQRRCAFPTTVVSNSRTVKLDFTDGAPFPCMKDFESLRKKFCSPWVYWKLHLMYALDLDSSWYVLYWSLFKNHLLLYWHKKPCLREHCWLNPKVSPHKVLSNCYHFGKAS